MKAYPYQLLRRMAAIRSPRMRQLGAWLLSATGRRFLGVFLDPVLAEKLRAQSVTVLMPARSDLRQLDAPSASLAAALQELTYCNVEPQNATSATLPPLPFSRLSKLLFGICHRKGNATREVTKKLAY